MMETKVRPESSGLVSFSYAQMTHVCRAYDSALCGPHDVIVNGYKCSAEGCGHDLVQHMKVEDHLLIPLPSSSVTTITPSSAVNTSFATNPVLPELGQQVADAIQRGVELNALQPGAILVPVYYYTCTAEDITDITKLLLFDVFFNAADDIEITKDRQDSSITFKFSTTLSKKELQDTVFLQFDEGLRILRETLWCVHEDKKLVKSDE